MAHRNYHLTLGPLLIAFLPTLADRLFWTQTRICDRFVNNRVRFAQTDCWESREYAERLETSCGDCCPDTSVPEGATVAFDRTAFSVFTDGLLLFFYLNFFGFPVKIYGC
jgi:hypothetical protein